jgi:hypothetical protein
MISIRHRSARIRDPEKPGRHSVSLGINHVPGIDLHSPNGERPISDAEVLPSILFRAIRRLRPSLKSRRYGGI